MHESEASIQELNNTGVALCADGNFAHGITLLRRAQAGSPNNPDLCCSLGNALAQQGDIAGATQYLTLAVRLDPDHLAAKTILESLTPLRLALEPSAIQPPEQIIAFKPQPRKSPARSNIAPPGGRRPPAVRSSQPQSAKAPLPEPKAPAAPRKPVPWKPIATAFAAVVFGIITYGGISAWQHRTVYGDKFTIVTAVPDTLDARQSLLNDNWSESAAAAAPDSARLLNAYCEVTATNSKGISVGTRLINGAFQAFENNGGNLQTLSTGPESGANSINDKGMVVGYTGQYTHHATLWLHGKMRDLNKTTPPTANLVLRDAVNINNAGTITATATDNLGNPLIVQLKPKY